MRPVMSAAILSAVFAIGFSASADVRAGKYVCRTPAGHETGSTFQLGVNGAYGDADGPKTGRVVEQSGELRFDGGDKDGTRALIISDTRIKVGKRIFCEWEQPKPVAAPAVDTEVEDAATVSPGAKLIVVKPDLRR